MHPLSLASPHAYELGQQAHKDGRKPIPIHDPALWAWLEKWRNVKGSALVIVENWSQGWHAANLAK